MANPFHLRDNVFEASTVLEATDTTTGFSVLNVIDKRPYTLWKAGSTGTKYITINAGASVNADSIGIAGHNLSTSGSTIAVEGATSTSGAWTTVLAGFTPTEDKAFVSTFSESSYTVWRLRIESASTLAYIGVLVLGTAFTYPQSPALGHDPAPESIQAEAHVSLKGQYLGSVIHFRPIEVQAKFRGLESTWTLGTFKPEYDNYLSDLNPFFWVFNSTDAYQSSAMYLRLKSDYEFKVPRGDAWTKVEEFSIDMEGSKE